MNHLVHRDGITAHQRRRLIVRLYTSNLCPPGTIIKPD